MQGITEQDVERAERYAETLERATEAWDRLPSPRDLEVLEEAVQRLAGEVEEVVEGLLSLRQVEDLAEVLWRIPESRREPEGDEPDG